MLKRVSQSSKIPENAWPAVDTYLEGRASLPVPTKQNLTPIDHKKRSTPLLDRGIMEHHLTSHSSFFTSS